MITVGDTVQLAYTWRIEKFDKINMCFTISVLKENGVSWGQLLVVPIFLNLFQIYPPYQQWVEPLDYLQTRASNVVPTDFINEKFQIGEEIYSLEVNKYDFRKRGLFFLRNDKKLREDVSTFLTYYSSLKPQEEAEKSISDQIHEFLLSRDSAKDKDKYYIDRRINREGAYICGRVVALMSSEINERQEEYVQSYHSTSKSNEVTAIIQDTITNYQFFCPVHYLVKSKTPTKSNS